jgi:hypothetical protein
MESRLHGAFGLAQHRRDFADRSFLIVEQRQRAPELLGQRIDQLAQQGQVVLGTFRRATSRCGSSARGFSRLLDGRVAH